MEKTKINFQDQFLNIARRERLLMEVELLSGERIRGYIKSFDNFCLLLESEGSILRSSSTATAKDESGGAGLKETGEQLIYKHATARIILLEAKKEGKKEEAIT
jgi:host factor-I protein